MIKKLYRDREGFKKLSVLALAVVATSCGKGDLQKSSSFVDGLIVGGQEVKEGKYQSVVGLVDEDFLKCTGNLVSANEVYTAAHCMLKMEFRSKKELENVFGEIAKVISKYVPEGGDLQTMTPQELRAVIVDAYKEVLLEKAHKIKIYFGNGVVGEEKQEGKDIVAEVKLSDKAISYATSQLLIHTTWASEEDKLNKYDESFDKAVLVLKENVEGVTPVPLATQEELQLAVQKGSEAKLVGFGQKVDARYTQYFRREILKHYKLIKEEETKDPLDPQKVSKLKKEFQGLSKLYMQLQKLLSLRGDKQYVSVDVESSTDSVIRLVNPDKEGGLLGKGACQGDSGGPVFIELEDGKLRQVAVIATVNVCGLNTNASIVSLKK